MSLIFWRNCISTDICSISLFRFWLRIRYSSSLSIPKKRLPRRLAGDASGTAAVKGSRIHAPLWVDAKTIRANTANGFCVGCLPHVFSHRAMAGQMPYVCHLLAAVDLFHHVIVITVRYFCRLACPDDKLR